MQPCWQTTSWLCHTKYPPHPPSTPSPHLTSTASPSLASMSSTALIASSSNSTVSPWNFNDNTMLPSGGPCWQTTSWYTWSRLASFTFMMSISRIAITGLHRKRKQDIKIWVNFLLSTISASKNLNSQFEFKKKNKNKKLNSG